VCAHLRLPQVETKGNLKLKKQASNLVQKYNNHKPCGDFDLWLPQIENKRKKTKSTWCKNKKRKKFWEYDLRHPQVEKTWKILKKEPESELPNGKNDPKIS